MIYFSPSAPFKKQLKKNNYYYILMATFCCKYWDWIGLGSSWSLRGMDRWMDGWLDDSIAIMAATVLVPLCGVRLSVSNGFPMLDS